MKNLIFLFSLVLALFCSIGTQAQDKGYTLKPDSWIQATTYGAADTITNNDDKYYVEYIVNKSCPLKYDVTLHLDKVSGNPNIAVAWQGKIFSADTYSNMATATWTASTADTTIKFAQHDTVKYYRYFRIYFDATATAQKSKVVTTIAKFWDK